MLNQVRRSVKNIDVTLPINEWGEKECRNVGRSFALFVRKRKTGDAALDAWRRHFVHLKRLFDEVEGFEKLMLGKSLGDHGADYDDDDGSSSDRGCVAFDGAVSDENTDCDPVDVTVVGSSVQVHAHTQELLTEVHQRMMAVRDLQEALVQMLASPRSPRLEWTPPNASASPQDHGELDEEFGRPYSPLI